MSFEVLTAKLTFIVLPFGLLVQPHSNLYTMPALQS
jgi:hypothetical protein